MSRPFWQTKTLSEMTAGEWESLCDGCGLCCLIRLEDEDTGEVIPTRVHCKLLDAGTCQCSNYPQRRKFVPDCIQLTPQNIAGLAWMPGSCAYRRIHEGKDLPRWHYLITGDRESVHRAGVSVRGQTLSETELMYPEEVTDYVAFDLIEDRSDFEP